MYNIRFMSREHVQREMQADRVRSALAAAHRMRVVAQASFLAFLAASAAACASGAVGAPARSVQPVPAEFRITLARLVSQRRLADATKFLRETDPVALARSASERADVTYFVVMGVGPVLPGLPPPTPLQPGPARKWIVPGTSDVRDGRDDEVYQVTAYDFAKLYNEALAREERGVR